MRTIDQIVQDFQAAAAKDYVGLWQVVSAVHHDLKPTTANQVQELSLKIVQLLLQSGLKAVDLKSGGGCVPWPDQRSNEILTRIESEWNALGKDPSIGDIVWFDMPTKG